MLICPDDLIRELFREHPYCCLRVMLVSICVLEYIGQSEASLKERPQCRLNLAFDSKVTRSYVTIIGIIKLQGTLWVLCGFVSMATTTQPPNPV